MVRYHRERVLFDETRESYGGHVLSTGRNEQIGDAADPSDWVHQYFVPVEIL